MLTILCEYLHNWFDDECKKHIGTVTIADGLISVGNSRITLKVGQYFRVIGSVFNDGVHQYPDYVMTNEEFDGAIWEMKIPEEVVALANEIAAWQDKYGGINSPAMSPFNSESFAGYSYSKSTGQANNNGDIVTSWQSAFRSRLNLWRKL